MSLNTPTLGTVLAQILASQLPGTWPAHKGFPIGAMHKLITESSTHLAGSEEALPRAEQLVILHLNLAPKQRDALSPRAARLLYGAVQAVELLLQAAQAPLVLLDVPA